jgi:hypothetical protein
LHCGGGSDGGGRGKGGHGGKGGGSGGKSASIGGAEMGSKPPVDRNKEKCHNSGKTGHWARDCHSKGKKEQAHVAEDDESSLLLVEQMQSSVLVTPALATISVPIVTTPKASDMMILCRTTPPAPARIIEVVEETVYAILDATRDHNTRQWIFDTGASNHMTEARDIFSDLDAGVADTVRFGDGSIVQIKGCGTILFACKTGEHHTLSNVYYIPHLTANIIN